MENFIISYVNNFLLIDGKKFISSRRAAEIANYSADYVGQLCREGRVNARRVGRVWFIEEESIITHKKNSDDQLVRNGERSQILYAKNIAQEKNISNVKESVRVAPAPSTPTAPVVEKAPITQNYAKPVS